MLKLELESLEHAEVSQSLPPYRRHNHRGAFQVLAMLREKLQCEALRTYLFAYGAFYSSLSLDQLCAMFGLTEKKVRSAASGLACPHSGSLFIESGVYSKGIGIQSLFQRRLYHYGIDSWEHCNPLHPYRISRLCDPRRAVSLIRSCRGSLNQVAGVRLQAHSVVSRMMVEEQLAGSWDQPTRTVVMHNAQPGRLQTLASELSDRAAALVDLNERALQLRTGGPREEDDGAGNYGEPGTRVRARSLACQSSTLRLGCVSRDDMRSPWRDWTADGMWLILWSE